MGFKVFLDVDTLRSGWFDERFVGELENACAVVVILSPGCLERCADLDDWVRQEIARSIQLHKHIVPLILPGFTFGELPEEIADLPKYNGIEYSHTYFHASMMRLESEIARACRRNKAFENWGPIVEDESA